MITINFNDFDDAIYVLKYESDWECYLDKQTGTIEFLDVREDEDVVDETDASYAKYIVNRDPVEKVAGANLEEDERERLLDLLDNEPQRFLKIEILNPRDGFQQMKDFVGTLPRSQAKTQLDFVLQQKKPFRRFRDTLSKFAKEKGLWQEFEKTQNYKYLHQFLKTQAIEAEVVGYE